MANFGVGISYIYRNYHAFQASFRDGVTSYMHAPVTLTRNCGNASCDQASYTGTYYQRTTAVPVAVHNTHVRPARPVSWHRGHRPQAVQQQLAAEQQLQLQQHAELQPRASRRGITRDPTNREFIEGKESGGLNGARWLGKIAGMYALPWSMSVSAFYNVREGLQFNRTIQSPNRTGSGGAVSVRIDPQGSLHYPVHKQLDLNRDKTVSFGRRASRSAPPGSTCSTRPPCWAVKRGRTSPAPTTSRRSSRPASSGLARR